MCRGSTCALDSRHQDNGYGRRDVNPVAAPKMDFGPLSSLTGLWWVVAVLVGGLVLFLIVAARVSRGRRAGGLKLPSTGVEICEGRPGAGKSFFGVGELLRAVLEERRPVYTNLPLRWRVFRAYVRLRGGEELSRLVFSIDRPHFDRFLQRTALRAEFNETWKVRRGAADREADKVHRAGDSVAALALRRATVAQFSAEAFEREFEKVAGVPIYSGPGANAIHATAFIVLDELHRWYSQEEQKSEGPLLRGYLTMHRHQLHRILVITQDRMQISIAFRRQAQFYWTVRDRGEDLLFGLVRFKHLGIRALGYAKFTPEQEDALKSEERVPSQQFTCFHWAPWENWKFRLYESFTHSGSKRGLIKNLSRARLEAGLGSDGRLEAEEAAVERRAAQRREARLPWVFLRCWSRRGLLCVVISLVFMIGRAIGRPRAPVSSDAKASAAAKVQAPVVWGKLDSISKDYVRVSGERVAVGGRIANGAVLQAVDVRARRSAWLRDGFVFVWKWGSKEPQIVGSSAEVSDAKARRLANRAGSEGQQGSAGEASGFVGPRQSDVVR